MVNNVTSKNLDWTFYALADPTRRAIITKLAKRECNVGELSNPFHISAPAISKHLAILQRTSLITTRKKGRNIICRLQYRNLHVVASWLSHYEKFWGERLDSLDRHLHKN